MTTTNLGLTTFNYGVDKDTSFEKFFMDLSGDFNSNMTKIDAWAGTIPILLSSLLESASGSMATIDSAIDSANDSLDDIEASATAYGTRIDKLAEYYSLSDNMADFSSISQSFDHLLLFGFVAVSHIFGNFHNIACDFNGDITTANYVSAQWSNSGSPTYDYTEQLIAYESASIILAHASGPENYAFATPFFAIIPNYSVTGGLYKCAMGLSAFTAKEGTIDNESDIVMASAAIQGGYWKSTAAINRIRLFGLLSTTRMNLAKYSRISLYGLY